MKFEPKHTSAIASSASASDLLVTLKVTSLLFSWPACQNTPLSAYRQRHAHEIQSARMEMVSEPPTQRAENGHPGFQQENNDPLRPLLCILDAMQQQFPVSVQSPDPPVQPVMSK